MQFESNTMIFIHKMLFKMSAQYLPFYSGLNVLRDNSGFEFAILYIYVASMIHYDTLTALWGIHAQEHAHVYIQWLIHRQIILFIIGLTPK